MLAKTADKDWGSYWNIKIKSNVEKASSILPQGRKICDWSAAPNLVINQKAS